MLTRIFSPLVIFGYPALQFLATLFGNLNVLSCGMHYGWSSPSLPKLLKNDTTYIFLSTEEISLIAIAIPIGGFCGAIIGGFTMDRIGRKWATFCGTIPTAASWLMIALANSFTMLFVARFLAGVSGGLTFSAFPIYISEICDPKVRGFLLSVLSFSWIGGTLIINVLGSYVTIPTAAIISLTCPIICMLTFSWMPETPYYLILRGKFEKAKESLAAFKKPADDKLEFERINTAIKEEKQNKIRYLDLITNRVNRKSMLIMIGTRCVQQGCGSMCIMFYAQVIFDEAGNDISPKIASIIYFSSYFIVTGISTVIVDRIGRKPLLIVSTAATGVVLLLVGLFFYIKDNTDIDTTNYSLIPTIGIIMYITVFSIGLQTIPLLIVGEIFPINIRQLGASIGSICLDCSAAIVVQIFQVTKDAYGIYVPFLIFACCCVLGVLFIFLYIPETTGLTLEEIKDILEK